MALTLKAAAGFQTSNNTLTMEGETSTGSTVTIESPGGGVPNPFHPEQSTVAKIFPEKTGAHFDGKIWTPSATLPNIVACYCRFEDQWPPDFDHNFVEVVLNSSGNVEFALRIEKNVADVDLYYVDSTGAKTLVGTNIIVSDQWHYVAFSFVHANSSAVAVRVDGVERLNTTGVDCQSATGDVQVLLRNSAPASPPANPTRLYFDGYAAWTSDVSLINAEIPNGFIVLTYTDDSTVAASDVAKNGSTPGDALDAGTWANVYDNDTTTYADYTSGNNGANALPNTPEGAPRSNWRRYGGYWAWRIAVVRNAKWRPIFGGFGDGVYYLDGDSAGYEESSTPGKNIIVLQDENLAGNKLPLLNGLSQMVQGFNHANSLNKVMVSESFACQVFEYPLNRTLRSFF